MQVVVSLIGLEFVSVELLIEVRNSVLGNRVESTRYLLDEAVASKDANSLIRVALREPTQFADISGCNVPFVADVLKDRDQLAWRDRPIVSKVPQHVRTLRCR